jgi:hypothetical protein
VTLLASDSLFGRWAVSVLSVHHLKPDARMNSDLMTGGADIAVGQWLEKVT